MQKHKSSPKTVIVKVTHSCNLNCKYCCVGDIVEHQLISETTLDNLFRKLSENCSESTIIWHGGEPLIAGLPFYKRALEIQAKYPEHKFKNSLQTNGTLLTNEYLDFFQANGFALGFSLDGCEISHNLNRPFKGDRDSFKVTFKWYKEVERRGMQPGAICVVNANTIKYIKEIYAFAKEYGVAFKFNAQYPAGRASINVDLGLDNKQLAQAYIELFDIWYDDNPETRVNIRMFEHFVNNMIQITHGEKNVQGFDCAWANRCQKSFIGISINGDVYPCGKFVDETEFLYGNINDNNDLESILDNDIRNRFLTRHREGISACKTCKYLAMCSSGCPHTAHLINNDILSKNPFCESVLLLFKHIEKRLIESSKFKDIFIIPTRDENNKMYVVYSPLRGGCFLIAETAKDELEKYLLNGIRPQNNVLLAHLELWKHKLPVEAKNYDFDTYNKCVILLSQECNLNCSYCYSKTSRSNETASKDNIKILIDHILSNRSSSQKIFSFIGGGEPTLNWSLLTWSIEYIRNNQHHNNVIISITTNGTLLTEDRILWLKEHKVDVGLSCDILPEIQNIQRPFKSGKGTFDSIDKTIKLLNKHNLFFRIRATISNKAVEMMPQMIEFIRDNYSFVSHVQLEPVQDNEQNDNIYYERFINSFMQAYEIGKKCGIDVYNMITLSLQDIKTKFCRGEFCMTPDGTFVACQRFSSERDKLFDKFRYGKIDNGKICIERESLAQVEKMFSQKLTLCKDCFAKYNCSGICTAVRTDLSGEQVLEHCQFTRNLLTKMLISYCGNIK